MARIKGILAKIRFRMSRLKVWQVSRQGILVESLIFAAIYVTLLYQFAGDPTARIWIDGLAVMVVTFTGALLIYISLPGITTRV